MSTELHTVGRLLIFKNFTCYFKFCFSNLNLIFLFLFQFQVINICLICSFCHLSRSRHNLQGCDILASDCMASKILLVQYICKTIIMHGFHTLQLSIVVLNVQNIELVLY